MLVPLIFAIWFGVAARRAERSVVAWSIGGAALAFVIHTIVVNVGALLFGPFSLDAYVAFRIVSAVVGIAIAAALGSWMLPSASDAKARRRTRYGHRPGSSDQAPVEVNP